METDPRRICVCATSLVETNGLGSSEHPECRPPAPRRNRTGSPRGLQQRRRLVGKGKVTPEMRYRSTWEQGAQGFVQSVYDPKARENCKVGRVPMDPTQPGPPEGPQAFTCPWSWQWHTEGTAPGHREWWMALANSYVFPFFIHINHRNPLHKAQFQLPTSLSGAARPLPGKHRPELLTQKYSITGNSFSFLPISPFFFFFYFSFFPSEQHWEHIQRVGVYRKCKCLFCYTKRNGGESWWEREAKGQHCSKVALVNKHLRDSCFQNPPVCHGSTGQREQQGTWGKPRTFSMQYTKKLCINKKKKSCKRNRRASSTLNPEFNEAEVFMLKWLLRTSVRHPHPTLPPLPAHIILKSFNIYRFYAHW